MKKITVNELKQLQGGYGWGTCKKVCYKKTEYNGKSNSWCWKVCD